MFRGYYYLPIKTRKYDYLLIYPQNMSPGLKNMSPLHFRLCTVLLRDFESVHVAIQKILTQSDG